MEPGLLILEPRLEKASRTWRFIGFEGYLSLEGGPQDDEKEEWPKDRGFGRKK